MADINENKGVEFAQVFEREWREVKKRRAAAFFVEDAGGAGRPAGLVGLALSGGGIRSATFCLGMLQGLNDLRLLRVFDYLSTVSGGGYVGGWWSAWLARKDSVARSRYEHPEFSAGSIHHPANLLVRIKHGEDDIARALRERIVSDARAFMPFRDYEEGTPPGRELVEALAGALNDFLKRTDTKPPCVFEGLPLRRGEARPYGRSMRDAGWAGEMKARAKLLAYVKDNYPWYNRLLLEAAYPYELKDIFPPEEKIEPARYTRATEARGAEGSMCAWRDPIHHLRLFANYLTPRRGMLSADTWRAVSIVARNMVLTWLILLPFLIAVTLVGQLYFLVYPDDGVRCAFLNKVFNTNTGLCEAPADGRLILAMSFEPFVPIVAAFLGWIVVISAFWLVYNREKSSATDRIIQIVTVVVLLVLLAAGGYVAISLNQWKFDWLMERRYFVPYLILSAAWLVVLAALIFSALRPLPDADGPYQPGGAGDDRWKREVWRNRFSRTQTRLLVALMLCLVVLFVSGYSHVFIGRLFDQQGKGQSGLLRIFIGLIPLLSAVAGSIFTAMKATPRGGGEKSVVREPSLVSRMIFAATPVLVVLVLAVSVTTLSHLLLQQLVTASGGQAKAINILLRVAGSFGVSLCVALAVYEMKNVDWQNVLRPKPGLFLFSFLLALNIGWAAHNVKTRVAETTQSQQAAASAAADDSPGAAGEARKEATPLPIALLSIAPDVLAILAVAAIVLIRTTIRVYRPGRRDTEGELRLANVLVTAKRFYWAAGFALLAFMGVGGLAGWKLYAQLVAAGQLAASQPDAANRPSGLTVLPYGLAILAGSAILFRLLIVRVTRASGGQEFKPRWRWFKSVWWLAAVCAVLPLFLICWGHVLYDKYWKVVPRAAGDDLAFPLLFPVAILLLCIALISLRKQVTRAVSIEGLMLAQGARRSFRKVLCKLRADEHENWTFQVLAVLGLGLALLSMCVAQPFLASEDPATAAAPFLGPKQLGVFDGRLLVVMLLSLLVSFLLFGVSAFQLPATTGAARPPAPPAAAPAAGAAKGRAKRQLFLWSLALLCVAVALFAGVFLSGWTQHAASERELPLGATDGIALLGMTACLTLVIFDMVWATKDNRRSALLVAFAYLGFLTFLVMGSFGQSPPERVRAVQIVLGLLAAALVWIVALGWMVDPNTVSMHQFYKGRLVRAYLGASNIRRLRHGDKEVTETVAGDDVPLQAVTNCQRGGPYHLINVTLNLAAGRDLSTAQRSAAAFTLSPLYCGSRRTDYRPTFEYMNGQLSLGTAVATSGAAVSPSMGSKKPTAALAMLMTLLNVRLGYWAPTPNRETWRLAQPRLWPFYLLREFLSQTNDISSYCYLTDGGHFDNTGLYALVERGCRYIVVADCGADPNKCFQDLGEAIRRCRIDFRAEIELSLEPLIGKTNGRKGGGGKSDAGQTRCFVVGRITYSEDHVRRVRSACGAEGEAGDEESRRGVIVYLKPAIIDEVSADVRQYSIENSFFPQQSTANQWFGEAQFESYRRLGELCVRDVFDGLGEVRELGDASRYSERSVGAIFEALARQCDEPPPSLPTAAGKTPDREADDSDDPDDADDADDAAGTRDEMVAAPPAGESTGARRAGRNGGRRTPAARSPARGG